MGNGTSKPQPPATSISTLSNTSQGKLFQDPHNGAVEVEERIFQLTSLQKQLIFDSWNNIEDKSTFGQLVLKRLFSYNSNFKRLYQLENVPDEKFTQMVKFMAKSDHISEFIQNAVNLLIKNEKAVLKLAKTFGQEHIKPRADIHADAQFWDSIQESICDEIECEQKNLGVQYTGVQYSETKMSKAINEAWGEMISKVIAIAKSAYAEAMRKLGNSKKQITTKAQRIAHQVKAANNV